MAIITDKSIQYLDVELGDFIKREVDAYSTLVDRKMVTATQLHDMTWRSVEALTGDMDMAETFGLLAALARRIRRYGTEGHAAGSTPFDYPFELGFGGVMRDALKAWDEGDRGNEIVLDLMRQYARDTLWYVIDNAMMGKQLYRRAEENEKEPEAA